jgi:hemerythrin superfamily protein
MAIGQRGLERRLRRETQRISSQHQQLDSLYAITTQALETGSVEAARSAFLRFSDALEAHVDLEDDFFFPAVRGLRPDLVSDLEALSSEHRGFRADLAELNRALEAGHVKRAEATLGEFVKRLAAHEEREEKLLARIRASEDAGG